MAIAGKYRGSLGADEDPAQDAARRCQMQLRHEFLLQPTSRCLPDLQLAILAANGQESAVRGERRVPRARHFR